ncbi:hypothetical protein J7E25_16860 [Agromyces sp. ISL-38]|uniref:hypothetical protein n=1 Tax=Agromyces sp. ISL-38 TaxID=2819107 RepID=UPI001BEAD1CE|nr:hypothetical protein [Agromyces sp. ISL-38]MBT2500768.1 hypothetical protein [Agromyces sp. ISL-38]MBT2518757.1 hypothetical protein [Streptomyces sp. ISL-90]
MVKRIDPAASQEGRQTMATPVPSRAVGRVSRAIGLSLGLGWVSLGSVGALAAGAEMIALIQLPTLLFILPGLILALRATMIGVKIQGSTLRIVSWWRTYRVNTDLVTELLVRHYSGYLNRWADGDVMGRHVKVLGIETGGRDRFFPATAMSNAAAETVIRDVGRALGVPVEYVP